MARTTRLAFCLVASLALAAPVWAAAETADPGNAPADQVKTRKPPAGSSGSSSAGTATRRTPPASAGPARSAGPGRPAAVRSTGGSSAGPTRASDQNRRRPPGSSSTGTATRRPPTGGSSGSSGSGGSSAGSAGARSRSVGSSGSSSGPMGTATRRTGLRGGGSTDLVFRGSGTRDRDGRPAQGYAVDRGSVTRVEVPLFGPWGRWFPYYNTGFRAGLGWVSFNPWDVYGATRWNWYRYGYYDPFYYDPFYPFGYGYSSYYGYGMRGASRGNWVEADSANVGSIRFKVNPKAAEIYIDGALAGTVDDFDGLGGHLKLDAGLHALELRAAGYETWTGELEVEAQKTLTKRVSLKEIK